MHFSSRFSSPVCLGMASAVVGGAMERVSCTRADGFALIDVIFVCGIIGVLMVIALPRLLLARQSASATSAIGSMRTISSAQLTFALTCGNGFYAPSLTTLGALPPGSPQGFLPPSLGNANSVSRSGYLIQMEATPFAGAPPSCNGMGVGEGGQGFKAGADPIEPRNLRFFATNATGQIYENDTSIFASMSETGEPATGHVLK